MSIARIWRSRTCRLRATAHRWSRPTSCRSTEGYLRVHRVASTRGPRSGRYPRPTSCSSPAGRRSHRARCPGGSRSGSTDGAHDGVPLDHGCDRRVASDVGHVAHADVLDRRDARGALSKVLVRSCATVHDAGVAGCVVRAHAPEVGVVREERRGRERGRGRRHPGDLGARRRSQSTSRSPPRTSRHRARSPENSGSISSESGARSVTVAAPAEEFQCTTDRPGHGGKSLVALGIDRRDAPVVGSVGDRAVERVRGAVDQLGLPATVHERAEQGIDRDR